MAWEPKGGRPRRTRWQEKTSAEIREMRERRMGEEIKDFLDHAANCPNCSGQGPRIPQGWTPLDGIFISPNSWGPEWGRWSPKWNPEGDPSNYQNWLRKNGYLD